MAKFSPNYFASCSLFQKISAGMKTTEDEPQTQTIIKRAGCTAVNPYFICKCEFITIQ